jgi:hypothetical protein
MVQRKLLLPQAGSVMKVIGILLVGDIIIHQPQQLQQLLGEVDLFLRVRRRLWLKRLI